jgi:hypothetical protein
VQDVLADADWERRQALQTAQVSLAELAERVVALTEISEQELRSGVKRPVVVAVRRAFIHLAVREFGHSGAAVARYLGVVASTVNRQAAREDLTPLAERLREKLTRGIA